MAKHVRSWQMSRSLPSRPSIVVKASLEVLSPRPRKPSILSILTDSRHQIRDAKKIQISLQARERKLQDALAQIPTPPTLYFNDEWSHAWGRVTGTDGPMENPPKPVWTPNPEWDSLTKHRKK